jgi:hypothetical protein
VQPKTLLASALIVAALAMACNDRAPGVAGDAGVDMSAACEVTAPTVCPDPPLRYADVSDIFGQRCAPCHYGAVNGPWPLLTYKHAADWYDVIRGYMLDCTMPPPESGMTMTIHERVALLTWIFCGVLE